MRIWSRAFEGALLLAAAGFAASDLVAGELRISGLERLYFERVSEIGPPSLHASAVAAALPARLQGAPRAGDTVRDEAGDPAEVSIADFPLPLAGRHPRATLREVRDTNDRIHLVWWALYADGRRQDCWFFSAFPDRTENKALANPAIEGLRRTGDGTIAIDVVSSMLRPQGAEWTSAWTLAFELTSRGLDYRSAEERYGMSRGYDTGDTPPATSYWTARPVGASVERKVADEVPAAVLASCGADTEETEAVARCVTAKAKVRIVTRPLATPAFIERGGKPAQ